MRSIEWFLVGHVSAHHYWLGNWDEMAKEAGAVPDARDVPDARAAHQLVTGGRLLVAAARGDVAAADAFSEVFEPMARSADMQDRGSGLVYLALIAQTRGDHADAVEKAQRALTEATESMGMHHPVLRIAVPVLLTSALSLGDLAAVEKLLDQIDSTPVGHLSPYLLGQAARFRARLHAATGDDADVEERFHDAERIFDEAALRFAVAEARGDLAEWLTDRGRHLEAAEVAASALATFEDLRIDPWIPRMQRLLPSPAASVTA
jgi:ATP/maltotriose-dependent transcriptional regulator MalT